MIMDPDPTLGEYIGRYMSRLGILGNVNEPHAIERQTDYHHILLRQRVLQYVWPQCIGLPVMYFDLKAIPDLQWWVMQVYRPHLHIMIEERCDPDTPGGIFVFLGWVVDADLGGDHSEHQTLLHFDLQNRVHTFYDPLGLWNANMTAVRLLEGWTPRIVPSQSTIQGILEGPPATPWSPGNVCAPVCALVMACCRRFATADISGVVGALCTVFASLQTEQQVQEARHGLWRFWMDLGTGNRFANAERSPAVGSISCGRTPSACGTRRALGVYAQRLGGTPVFVVSPFQATGCIVRTMWMYY